MGNRNKLSIVHYAVRLTTNTIYFVGLLVNTFYPGISGNYGGHYSTMQIM